MALLLLRKVLLGILDGIFDLGRGCLDDAWTRLSSRALLGPRQRCRGRYVLLGIVLASNAVLICLVLGIAIPARDELERARAVRDRFAAEVLPKLRITSKQEPKEAY